MTRSEHREAQEERLKRLFDRRRVAQLDELRRALSTSGRTVLRVLGRMGYLTSYRHAGGYYTLRAIPSFDERGLWFYHRVRFSSHGTLRATVVFLVEQAAAGYTHEELEVLLGLRVQDTLRSLVRASEIGRESVDAVYVYVHRDQERAASQLRRRRAAVTEPPPREPN